MNTLTPSVLAAQRAIIRWAELELEWLQKGSRNMAQEHEVQVFLNRARAWNWVHVLDDDDS